MLKLKSYLLIFTCAFVFNSRVFAQQMSRGDLIEAAYHAFGMNDYADAYPLFDNLVTQYPDEVDFKFRPAQ